MNQRRIAACNDGIHGMPSARPTAANGHTITYRTPRISSAGGHSTIATGMSKKSNGAMNMHGPKRTITRPRLPGARGGEISEAIVRKDLACNKYIDVNIVR